MSDNMPDMIPMPGNPGPDPRGNPPDSFSKQLSKEEEQKVLLNFMGSMYGETKKMDGQIVNGTNTLTSNKSQEIKRKIEQVVSEARQSVQQAPAVQPSVQQPQVQEPVPVQQQPVTVQPQIQDDNQLSFNFDINEKDELFSLIEKVLTRLDKLHKKVDDLSDSIKNNNVTSLPIKKTAKKKSVKKEEV